MFDLPMNNATAVSTTEGIKDKTEERAVFPFLRIGVKELFLSGCLFFVLFLLSYFPVVQGYFLANDDYWGFVFEYESPLGNPMFHTQAYAAGRPLGALIMSTLQFCITSVAAANWVRFLLIVGVSLAAVLLFGWFRRLGMGRSTAFLLAAVTYLLPCFHSSIYCVTDGYAMYGTIPALLSAFALLNLAESEGTSKVRGLFQWGLAIFLFFLAMVTYPMAAMLFWALIASMMVLVKRGKVKAKLWLPWTAGMVSMAAYLIFFRLTQEIYSNNQVAIDPAGKLLWFFKIPFAIAMNFWHRPSIEYINLWQVYEKEPLLWVTIPILLLGWGLNIVVSLWSAGNIDLSLRSVSIIVAHHLCLGGLCILTVFPLMVSSWTGITYHYMTALMPLLLWALIWAFCQCTTPLLSIFRLYQWREQLLVSVLVLLCIGAAFNTYSFMQKDVSLPLSTELGYIKHVLGEKDPAKIEQVHLIQSNRRDLRFEVIGFQTNYGWAPALVLTALKELSAERQNFAVELENKWNTSWAMDAVTQSTKKDFKSGGLRINPATTTVIDMTRIEFLIALWQHGERSISVTESALEENTVNLPARAKMRVASNVVVHGASISGGDYPGFPADLAFDKNFATTRWASEQTGLDVSGNAYIGYDFKRTPGPHIRQIVLRQAGAIPSVLIQSSHDGSSWTTVTKLELKRDNNTYSLKLPSSGPARFWRILATSNAGEGPPAWAVYEVEMMEKEIE